MLDTVASEATKHRRPHTFHIPVMGTGFSVDTPLRVAKYGISSVISLVDDTLLEQIRQYHCKLMGRAFDPIRNSHPDRRAARTTAYLNLMNDAVTESVTRLRESPFEPGSEITRYFELLPETPLKSRYALMCATDDPETKRALQDELRAKALPGDIDVNIMTKLDCENWKDGNKLDPIYNDGMAALRGYAQSNLTNSSIVFSAGLNARIYTYAAEFPDFFASETGECRKRIVLKVSDYRSAMIQGRFFAKRGLWVSEFRIESGINCGGHTFPTVGLLMGPILEEFKQKRGELQELLHRAHNAGRVSQGLAPLDRPPELRITAQGGIGTVSEQDLMLKYYNMDGTGWGTPFLLVPDVSAVDDEHLQKLLNCSEGDVYLSDSSPVGVPFWNLRTSASEEKRRRRIAEGHPGSPCPKGYLRFDSTMADTPLCQAASVFQKQRMKEIDEEDSSPQLKRFKTDSVLHKSCICDDLGGSALRKYGINANATPAVCCGPNISYFKRLMSLDEIVGHIYGRISVFCNSDRPHMFIQELRLYVQHLRNQMEEYSIGVVARAPEYFEEFKSNLIDGIQYYRHLSRHIVEDRRERFLSELSAIQKQIERLAGPSAAAESCT